MVLRLLDYVMDNRRFSKALFQKQDQGKITLVSFYDCRVYSKNLLFRMTGQSKLEKLLLPLGAYGVEVSDFSCSSVCLSSVVTLRIDPKRNPKIRQFRRNNGKIWTKNGSVFWTLAAESVQ